ncbi:MAG: hypothetical protein KQH79_17090 [Bacteroidetes bacterium]|nr:hypothetical protein [Bacteroidota bacterium]
MISEVKKADELRCKVKKKAALLSKSVKQAKNLGVDITANAPIEGKMFW